MLFTQRPTFPEKPHSSLRLTAHTVKPVGGKGRGERDETDLLTGLVPPSFIVSIICYLVAGNSNVVTVTP